MPLLSQVGLILAAYLAAGRVGVIATCMFTGITPGRTLMIAMLIDMFQIPVYGFLLEISRERLLLPKRIRVWVTGKFERIKQKMEKGRFGDSFARLQPMAVVAVSFLPLRGFGVFSACILSFMLNYSRFFGTLLIMSGSLAGSVLSILVFYFPARWFNAL